MIQIKIIFRLYFVIQKYCIIVINTKYEGDIMFKVKSGFKGTNISRTIRFNEELYEQLSKIAEKNKVSFNLLILQCCKYAIDNISEENEKAK